jgi:hypothetical protein
MKVNSVETGLTIRSRADAADIANWVKFYGRHMLDMREKKTELAKQVEEKRKGESRFAKGGP